MDGNYVGFKFTCFLYWNASAEKSKLTLGIFPISLLSNLQWLFQQKIQIDPLNSYVLPNVIEHSCIQLPLIPFSWKCSYFRKQTIDLKLIFTFHPQKVPQPTNSV